MIPDNESLPQLDASRLRTESNTQIECAKAAAVRGELVQVSSIERDQSAETPLAVTVAWIRTFLARPHAEVGRPRAVCPFTPTALSLDTIWLTEVTDSQMSRARMIELIDEYRELFADIEPRGGQLAINKAILVVFPHLGDSAAAVIEDVQAELKPGFVELGLMLGEFHPTNDSPGLRNPDFRPLRSPIPMLAIRQMVETDLPFLRRPLDAPELRSRYLRSYLRRLGGSVRRKFFDDAVVALIDAELELQVRRTAVAQDADALAVS